MPPPTTPAATRRARGALLGLVALALVAGASGAAAEERRVEAVGAAPLGIDSAQPAREAALENAVRNAVLRVARELVPGGLPASAGDEEAWLAERLGDPLAYSGQFSIVEDRGERPAMFASDPSVESEYVVLAAVGVDVGAVADRLASLGLLAPDRARQQLLLVVEGLEGYQALVLLQRALERDRGVRSVVPVEFTPGRAVLALAADRDAREIVSDLEASAPAGLEIVATEVGARQATLRVRWHPEPEPVEGEESAGD